MNDTSSTDGKNNYRPIQSHKRDIIGIGVQPC